MESFEDIYHRAAERKGGEAALKRLISKPKSKASLAKLPDAFLLAEFSRKVFQSGFVWRVVNQKWPDFERVFFDFEPEKLLLMPDEMLERKAQDPSIIRNYRKCLTIRENALMLNDLARRHGSAAKWLAEWPYDDIIGLWAYLKKHGSRLGGNTGPYALRAIGKDTFVLSQDVETFFRAHKLIEGGLTSKKSLATIQQTFNAWRAESGQSLQAISQTLAYSLGKNHVGVVSAHD